MVNKIDKSTAIPLNQLKQKFDSHFDSISSQEFHYTSCSALNGLVLIYNDFKQMFVINFNHQLFTETELLKVLNGWLIALKATLTYDLLAMQTINYL